MNRLIFSADQRNFSWADAKAQDETFGTKGSTALAIPRAWTLPFALLSVGLVNEIIEAEGFESPLTAELVAKLCNLSNITGSVIVRSSVVGESIWERGTFASEVVLANEGGELDKARLFEALQKVHLSSRGRPIAVMMQAYLHPAARGEFGNLQRISKTRDQWEISIVERDGIASRIRLNSQRDQAANPEAPISVKAGLAQERLFGRIGAWLNNELLIGRLQRLNCEWVTDNRAYYLVQVDQEDEDVYGTNPFQVRIPSAPSANQVAGNYLKPADETALKKWDKLKVLDELWEPGASHKPVLFYVELKDLPNNPETEDISNLVSDFRLLLGESGIIVRTSVAAGKEKILNLPRTECLNAEAATKWCFEQASILRQNHPIDGIAFVSHRFIAARASAWVRVDPGNPTVEINALWGLPDALQYCPFDIWEVHIPTGVATEYPDYKSDMLISQPNGDWKYVRVKNELARKNCITSTEAKELAVRSSAISEKLGKACHIMWFIGCEDEHQQSFCIPWYWTEAHVSERNADRQNYKVVEVSDRDSLQQFIAWEGSRVRQALALRPTNLDLMRDNDFIESVGNAARQADVPVILYGSTLAHAYYQLRKAGCAIVTPSEKEHYRVRRSADFGKLVRDKIPKKIAKRQEVEISRKVPVSIKKGFLISKLFEEALEVREARDKTLKTEELGDVYEVLRAIANAEEIEMARVTNAADAKKQKAGGFDEGFVLMQTGITSSGKADWSEIDRVVSTIVPGQVSNGPAAIPFSFFGFMEIDQPRAIYFEEMAIWLEITLRLDRFEISLSKAPEQLSLEFGQDDGDG